MLLTKETFRELDSIKKTGLEYKVTQIFLKAETKVYPTKRVCEVVADSGERVVIKARHSGVVKHLLIKPGDVVKDGSDLMELEACTHPTMMGNICCDCGVMLEENEMTSTDVVSMLHAVPDLKIKKNEAEKLGKEDITNLLGQRKLVLLVDLDQTLIHTTNDNIPNNLKDVCHFKIYPGGPWYHTRVRPHTKQFLEKISRFYELHICTFGVREYAHYIAHFLDPSRKLFGQRILSRNECLDHESKKANLSSLFPCGDNLVCIIDDRTDVWNYSPNVIQVMPYHFFRHTGDINAPQGLQKKEEDDQKGFDFENIKSSSYGEGSDTDEADKKNYSSDSDSDKDTKEAGSDGSEASVSEGRTPSESSTNRKEDQVNEKNTKSNEVTLKEERESVEQEKPESTNVEVTTKENGSKEVTENPVDTEIVDKEEVKVSSDESDKSDQKESKSKDYKDTEVDKQKDFIDVKDSDDFLLYLEDILKKIHKAFFKEYDKRPEPSQHLLPDMKRIIPSIRQEVLKGVNIVFSGVVPQQVKLKESKAYFIAASFGAKVSERLIVRAKGDSDRDENKMNYTTHMVAANVHTEKVHKARKHKSIKIVTPNWLWTCAERWEHVEERLFPLDSQTEKDIQRLPPHHCYFPDTNPLRVLNSYDEAVAGPSGRVRTPSGNLMEGVNPLMYLNNLSNNERNIMASEVDDMLSEDNTDDESDNLDGKNDSDEDGPVKDGEESDEEESEDEMNTKRCKRIAEPDLNSQDSILKTEDEDSLLTSEGFRQSGGLASDDSDDGVMDDEGDLSRMGADLESMLD